MPGVPIKIDSEKGRRHAGTDPGARGTRSLVIGTAGLGPGFECTVRKKVFQLAGYGKRPTCAVIAQPMTYSARARNKCASLAGSVHFVAESC